MQRDELALVGRASELKILSGLLRDSGLGFPRAAVVTGEPGMGKTRLLAEYSSIAAKRGFGPVVVRGLPATQGVPGGTLLSVLPTAPPTTDDSSRLWWLKNTVVATADRPVLVVDDAHLADELTLALCAVLADSGQVPVVLAARSTDSHPESLTRIREAPGVKRVDLEPLSLQETQDLVSEAEGVRVPLQSAREVHELTDGVPLVALELVKAARECGMEVSTPRWQWSPEIATGTGLGSLLEGRLLRMAPEARQVLWMAVAAGGSAPTSAVVRALSQDAVDETLERGLLRDVDGWLRWSHALLGELGTQIATGHELEAARQALGSALRSGGTDDPSVLQLAARLDLESPEPDRDLQLAAGERSFIEGRSAAALRHAEGVLETAPEHHGAHLLAARAAIRLALPQSRNRVRSALATCTTDDEVVETATKTALLIFASTGDVESASQIIAEAKTKAPGSRLASRLEYVRLVLTRTALPSEDFVEAVTRFIEAPGTHSEDRTAIEGHLAIGLAVLGEVERAAVAAAGLRISALSSRLDYETEIGFYGGALAALFSGDALEATRLAVEGSKVPVPLDQPEAALGRRSIAYSMRVFRGHCNSDLESLARTADETAILRYSVMTRLVGVWGLALTRDPVAHEMWEEIQEAPRPLRAGASFLEAIAGVALAASSNDIERSAQRALEAADALGPARSAVAWLLHDAARHGHAAEVVGELETIAASQERRYLPAVLADSARAIRDRDPDQLTSIAAEFRERGFDLFAAEAEVLAWQADEPASTGYQTHAGVARAHQDLQRAGEPWTPIIDALTERDTLTDRQRAIVRLVVAGLTNGEVAARLGISKRTVENQLYRVYAKLGVDRAGLSELRL